MEKASFDSSYDFLLVVCVCIESLCALGPEGVSKVQSPFFLVLRSLVS